ncbi:MAG TPA: pseudouridine synthase [Polyangiales bacterium]
MSDEPALAPRVVHRDDDLIVFDKPTGLPTTSPDGGRCLASLARGLDPQAVRMHPSSRLDAEVTGLVTFARSDRGIRALLHARGVGAYQRCYVGLCASAPEPPTGELRWAIGKDPRDPRRRQALPEGSKHGVNALSGYELVASAQAAALLLLRPQTGRTHQLRVHICAAGAPLLGDKHYGGATRVVLADGRVVRARRVMLHCARVVLPSLTGEGQLLLRAPIPDDMAQLWRELGGDAAVLSALELRLSALDAASR